MFNKIIFSSLAVISLSCSPTLLRLENNQNEEIYSAITNWIRHNYQLEFAPICIIDKTILIDSVTKYVDFKNMLGGIRYGGEILAKFTESNKRTSVITGTSPKFNIYRSEYPDRELACNDSFINWKVQPILFSEADSIFVTITAPAIVDSFAMVYAEISSDKTIGEGVLLFLTYIQYNWYVTLPVDCWKYRKMEVLTYDAYTNLSIFPYFEETSTSFRTSKELDTTAMHAHQHIYDIFRKYHYPAFAKASINIQFDIDRKGNVLNLAIGKNDIRYADLLNELLKYVGEIKFRDIGSNANYTNERASFWITYSNNK